MTSSLEQFAEIASRPDPEIELELAALLLGSIANDGALDLERCRVQLDELAERSRANLSRLEKSSFSPARAVSITLFNELGFRGNTSDYYDLRTASSTRCSIGVWGSRSPSASSTSRSRGGSVSTRAASDFPGTSSSACRARTMPAS